MPKAKGDEAFDVASQALLDFAGETDVEEKAMDERSDDDDDDDDGEGGPIDQRDETSQEEQLELDAKLRPVRLVLVKVSLNSAQT
jgi:hypothetical protein